MAVTDTLPGPLSESEHGRHLRRAVIASTVGTTIEWYDFLIYSTMTGLVFGHVFFSGSDPLTDTLKAFGVFFIGFVARPIGAAIFGHYGDRIGRKATLIVTLLMTGIATALVGLVPGDQFLVWGWRIPFLLSIVMVAVGLWIRLGILETPVFRRILEENQVARAPTIEVFRKQPKEIVLTALLRLAEQSPGYIFNAFIFTYGTQVLGASRDLLLIGLITTTALAFLWAP